jgi:acyl-CoA synthetase (AMP-forming)/AMP-acid ligase II
MLTVTDRLKDVIKTGGEWVSSLELESIISQHPAVNEVAVIGVKDDKWGERPLAMVVLKAGQAATADDIKATSALCRRGPHLEVRGARRVRSSTAWRAPASASSTRRPCASIWPDDRNSGVNRMNRLSRKRPYSAPGDGAQIAAHLANANVPVVLFDLPAKEGDKNGIVKKASTA